MRRVEIVLGGDMQDFKVSSTVSLGYTILARYWSDLLRINIIPILVIFIVLLVSYTAGYLKPDMTPTNLSGDVLLIFNVAIFLFAFFLLSAASMNWQHFILSTLTTETKEQCIKDSIVNASWWKRYGLYLINQIQLFGSIGVIYFLFILLTYWDFAVDFKYINHIVVGFSVITFILMPVFCRLSLVLPNIAADFPKMTYRAALKISIGKGWKIYFSTFLTGFIFVLVMLILAIVLGVFVGLLAVFSGSVGTALIVIISLIIDPLYYVTLSAVMAGSSALILLQLKPELNDRWLALKVYEDLGGEPDTSTSLNSENSNTRLNTVHSYGRRKSK